MGRRPEMEGRQLIIDAARSLFAHDGIGATSIRSVNRAAGLGPASVHYHFSTKDGLLDAVLHEHGDAVVDAIIERAEDLIDAETVTGRDIVSMYAGPYIDLLATHGIEGLEWVMIVHRQMATDRARVRSPKAHPYTDQAIAKAYPDADPDHVARARDTLLEILIAHMAQLDDLPDTIEARREYVAGEIDFLIGFLSGGLDATLRQEGSTIPSGA